MAWEFSDCMLAKQQRNPGPFLEENRLPGSLAKMGRQFELSCRGIIERMPTYVRILFPAGLRIFVPSPHEQASKQASKQASRQAPLNPLVDPNTTYRAPTPRPP